MKNIGYKELLVFALLLVIVWFILKPSSDKQELKADSIYTKNATTNKVKYAFKSKSFASQIKKLGFKHIEDYLNSKGLTTQNMLSTAILLYNSKGLFNDDEDAVNDKIRAIPNLTIFSIINYTFFVTYKTTLQDFLSTFLNEKELNKIYLILEKKAY